MDADFSRMWLAMKVVVASKQSHGKRDLQDAMTRIELACISEGDRAEVERLVATVEQPSRAAPVGTGV